MTSALARRVIRIEERTGLNRARSVREMTDEELDEAIRVIMAGEGGLRLARSAGVAAMSDEVVDAMVASLVVKANRGG
jgi:hypothetical protein